MLRDDNSMSEIAGAILGRCRLRRVVPSVSGKADRVQPEARELTSYIQEILDCDRIILEQVKQELHHSIVEPAFCSRVAARALRQDLCRER